MVFEKPKHVMREQLWSILAHGKGRLGRMYDTLLVLLIVISLAILPLEFIPQLEGYRGLLTAIETLTTALFTMEYALHIYAAPNRAKYLLSFYGLVDLFSILPFYVGFLGTQYVRVFRLLRLVRLGEIEGATIEDERALRRGLDLVPGETIVYVVTMHPVYLILGCLPPVLSTSIAVGILLFFGGNAIVISLACCLVLFAVMFIWKTWLDYRYDVIYVTSRRLIWQNQYLLGRSINQVNYHAITNVKPYFTSFLGYLLRYGSIKIETTAAEPGHTELHMVRNHEQAAHVIMQRTFGTEHVHEHAAHTHPEGAPAPEHP
jgi:uncharacterized membrane protein YozB (DUF420 family)